MKKYLLIFLITPVWFACVDKESSDELKEGQVYYADTLPGQSPYLSRSADGSILLSWVRMNPDSTAEFCYATSNGSVPFGKPVVVPGTGKIQPHGENLPKIIRKPSGDIIALWGVANPNPKNKHSGLVYYVQSFDEGRTWTQPRSINDDTASFDQRYYDVAVLPDGEAGLVWLDNRKMGHDDGSLVYFSKTAGRDGFGIGKVISKPACPCCRTVLYPDKKGNIHVLYRGIIRDSIRDMVHIVSTDEGKSFSEPKRISPDNWVINACPHTGPSMTENKTGLHFAWYTGASEKGCYYSNSTDNGNSFNGRQELSVSGSHPQVATLENDNVVAVWDQFVNTGTSPARRIAMQSMDPSGKKLEMEFITSDSVMATYPVVAKAGNYGSIIAYTVKKNGYTYIAYQLVIP